MSSDVDRSGPVQHRPEVESVHGAGWLDAARSTRAARVGQKAAPGDTVHIATACSACGARSERVLGPDEPWSSMLSPARIESLGDAARLLAELATTPAKGAPCDCRAVAKRTITVAMRWVHTAVGTGHDVVLEIAARTPEGLPGPQRERVLLAPVDGPERTLAESLDDAAVTRALGRTLSLTPAWSALLTSAIQGESAMCVVEPGQWIYAGPAAPNLGRAIDDLVRVSATRRHVPLGAIERGSATWGRLEGDAASRLADGSIRAGMIWDVGELLSVLSIQLARVGVRGVPAPGGTSLRATLPPVEHDIEVATLATESLSRMLTLSETAAAAADATAARLRVAEATLRALALRRPAVRWVIEGLTARGIAPDGTTGRPVPLFRDDEPDVPAPVDLERDARYATEPQPPWADPTRVCGCGASAWISARLLAGPDAERLLQRDPADAPMIVSVFRNGETPVAVRMATVVCERHVCVLSQRDVQVLGLTPAELTRRLEADREREWFRYESMTLADPSGARGVVVWGRNVASAFFHDDLLSGLHAALARPLGDATRATAIASTPGSLVLGDPMLEPEVIERLVSNGALREGLAAGTETPFRLTRTIDLTASPCGRWSARTADHGSSPGE